MLAPRSGACRRACWTGIRTVPISDSAITVPEDVIAGVLAFHARGRDRDPAAPPAPGYRAESLQTLFGEDQP